MWQKIIGMALTQLFKYLDVETVKEFVDRGLDAIENKHIDGEVDTLKEEAITQAISLIRKILNIDDAKYGSDKE